MNTLTKTEAETADVFHVSESCHVAVKVGPRGGITVGRTEVYRRNGRTQTWKTRPDEYSIPVKYGLKEAFRITNTTSEDVHVGRPEDCPKGTLRDALVEVGLRQPEMVQVRTSTFIDGTCEACGSDAFVATITAAEIEEAKGVRTARLQREALQRVEWFQQQYNGRAECPWCHSYRDEGHTPSCLRQAALSVEPKPA